MFVVFSSTPLSFIVIERGKVGLEAAQRKLGERSGRGGKRFVNGVLETSLVREARGREREGE